MYRIATITHPATLALLSQCDRMAYWYNPKGQMTPEQALEQVSILIRRMLGTAA